MKVLFDSQIFKLQQYGGISRYFSEVLSGLNTEVETFPRDYFSRNKHLRRDQLTFYNNSLEFLNFCGKGRLENLLRRYHESKVINMLKNGDFDVFHPTYYDPYFLEYISGEKPFVLTVHDMIHELYYDDYFQNIHFESKGKKLLIPKATHIIAVSQNTKNDIVRFFPEIDERKISVIYHGSSLILNEVEADIRVPERYILFVGNRGFYKNFVWFLHSIGEYLNATNLFLICAGGPPFTDYEQSLIDCLHLCAKVQHVAIESDMQLTALYKRAACFVFPSLFEGFGIPILEAFSCGCPVILANSSCFPEVGGDAAVYFDVDKPETLVQQISNVTTHEDLANSLRTAGSERVKLFSWHATLEQHYKVYKSLCN